MGTFRSGSTPGTKKCQTVITFSGATVENTESFLLQLSSFDSVIVSDGMAVVSIIDDDGKCR